MDISVVIPCRNEEKYIVECVNSVFLALEGLNGEVIVVDGQSEDRTIDLLSEMGNFKGKLRVLTNKNKTTPIALNMGILEANGDYVGIMGAHSITGITYFKEGLKILKENPKIGCVGGVLENVFEDGLSACIGKAMTSSFGVGNAHFRTGVKEGIVDTVAFGVYPKRVFDDIGLFDENLPRNQDDELNFRVNKGGYEIYLSSNMRAKYFVRGNYRKLFNQYFQYGFWKVKVNIKHRQVTTVRQLAPPIFVLGLILGLVLSFLSWELRYIYCFFLLLYFLMSIYFSVKNSNNFKECGNLFLAYFILHFSYGLGYLDGILKFGFFGGKLKSNRHNLTR